MGKNDTVWERIFDDYHVVDVVKEEGAFFIDANEIKGYGREPRLMAKFDHKINLPEVFRDNGLSILPTTRGQYIISSFEAYQTLEEPEGDIIYYSVPDYIQTLSQEFIVSEAIAINCANACGIMSDFLEDDKLKATISGRMGSSSFSFNIKSNTGTQKIDVTNSQIEIDASFEGAKYFSIIEAKKDLAKDFLVRQLYYPYRVWKDRVSKPIKTVFFVYSDGIFNLYQYEFEEPRLYNSAKLVKFQRYSISSRIKLDEIKRLLYDTKIVHEPEVPFPQADSMARIINLLELLNEQSLSKQEITSTYDFDKRQTDYYTSALSYLGLSEKYREGSMTKIRLSNLGKKIMSLKDLKARKLQIVNLILSHRPFNETLKLWINRGAMPEKVAVEQIMRESNLYNVRTDNTYHRRASTILGWLKWIMDLTD